MPFKLSKEQEIAVEHALRQLHDLLPEMDKAEECGADCLQHRMQARKLQKQLEAIRQQFGKPVGTK